MHVIRATSAGFCLGVSLALRRLNEELTAFGERQQDAASGGRLITLGPIIHNPLVIEHYSRQGVICQDGTEGLAPGDRVVIRAHGIPREVEARLGASGAGMVDATCPKVKRAQLAIAKKTRQGGTLVLFGEPEHPEVQGLLSYANPQAQVFSSLEELDRLSFDDRQRYFLAAQTTQERAIYLEAQNKLSERLGYEPDCLDTICDATRDRQQEVLELCAKVDAMVVVGGLNSGNTRRLAEVSRAQGVPAVHVEQVSDLDDAALQLLRTANVIGLTAGASTPDSHINAMHAFLEELEPLDKK